MGGLGATGGSGLPRPAGLRIGAGRLPAVERRRRIAIHRPARGAFVWLPAVERGRRVAVHRPARGAFVWLPAVERGRRVAVHRPARGAFVWLPAEEQGRRVAAVVVRPCFVAPGNGRTRG